VIICESLCVYVTLSDEKGHTLIERGREPIDNALKNRMPVYYQQNGTKGTYLGEPKKSFEDITKVRVIMTIYNLGVELMLQ